MARAEDRGLRHVTVYREAGRFGGWPANHGNLEPKHGSLNRKRRRANYPLPSQIPLLSESEPTPRGQITSLFLARAF